MGMMNRNGADEFCWSILWSNHYFFGTALHLAPAKMHECRFGLRGTLLMGYWECHTKHLTREANAKMEFFATQCTIS